MDTIRNWQSSHSNRVFRNLREVGAELKSDHYQTPAHLLEIKLVSFHSFKCDASLDILMNCLTYNKFLVLMVLTDA